MNRSLRGTVLRTLAYGDTSLILRFLTAESGVLTVMGRGLRSSRRKSASVPQLFSSGTLTIRFRDNREMHPLQDFTADRVRLGLSSSLGRLAGAALLGDLILRHSGHESQEAAAELVEAGLDDLETVAEEHVGVATLSHAWGLVASLGYRPLLDRCVECGRPFGDDEMGRFDLGRGGVMCSDCGEGGPRVGPVARSELRRLIDEGPSSADREPVSKLAPHLKLLADFASYHVAHGKRIAAFDYFMETLSQAAD